MKRVVVKQSAEKEEQVPVEILAQSIREISSSMKRMRRGPFGDEALFLLIQRNCRPIGKRYPKHNITMKEVQEVIRSIESLESAYLRKSI